MSLAKGQYKHDIDRMKLLDRDVELLTHQDDEVRAQALELLISRRPDLDPRELRMIAAIRVRYNYFAEVRDTRAWGGSSSWGRSANTRYDALGFITDTYIGYPFLVEGAGGVVMRYRSLKSAQQGFASLTARSRWQPLRICHRLDPEVDLPTESS